MECVESDENVSTLASFALGQGTLWMFVKLIRFWEVAIGTLNLQTPAYGLT